MKIVAIEEHFVTDAVMAAWQGVPEPWRDPQVGQTGGGAIVDRLKELGDQRIADMDASGIDVQVLSLTASALHSLAPADAVALQRETNDLLAEAIAAHPDRLAGFAALAMPDPAAAARELERAVTQLGLDGAMLFGHVRAANWDDAAFRPVFEAAAHLRAPLYLHPQAPVPGVRDAYYSGFGEGIDPAFATFGLGWHYEAGVQLIRLILSGTFDRYPELQVVTGHWGEVVLFYLDRIDNLKRVVSLKRPISEYFRTNISVTPSGIWSERYLRWALEVVGPERILFSTDYPYRFDADGTARRFFEEAAVSDADREKIAHGNWARLVANIRR